MRRLDIGRKFSLILILILKRRLLIWHVETMINSITCKNNFAICFVCIVISTLVMYLSIAKNSFSVVLVLFHGLMAHNWQK